MMMIGRLLLVFVVVGVSVAILLLSHDPKTVGFSKGQDRRHCAVGGEALLDVPRAVGGENSKARRGFSYVIGLRGSAWYRLSGMTPRNMLVWLWITRLRRSLKG